MPPLTVEQTDLEPILRDHPGNRAFADALAQVDGPESLMRVLTRYIHFNATFGAGVANLAALIGVRQHLFQDREEPISLFADRSMDVAADIFAAAVDEFDDRATDHRDTHRSLALATLKASLDFFKLNAEQTERVTTLNEATRKAIEAVHQGYAVARPLTDADLFQAIGFHMGSEVLADEEFHHLDAFLRERFPELVAHLEATRVFINGEHHASYFWVRIHTSVEADHFTFAVRGANRALKHYVGPLTPEQAKADILDGIREFAEVQAGLMAAIGQ